MIVASDGSTVVRAVEKKDDAMFIVSSVNHSARLVEEHRRFFEEECNRLRRENNYLRGIEIVNGTLADQLLEARKKLEEYEKK